MEKEKIGLMPLSEEEVNDYYAGWGCQCPGTAEDEPGPYNPDCCWHDCDKGNQSTKFLAGWAWYFIMFWKVNFLKISLPI